MFRIMSRLLMIAALAFVGSSCAVLLVGAAAGGGGIAYVSGNLEEVIGKPVIEVHHAAQAALKELQLPPLHDVGNLKVKMESQFADGAKVWINIRKLSDTATKIRIRVGYKGDEVRSRNILDAVKRQLGLMPSAAPTPGGK